MTSTQLVQMALSAILRCNEKVDFFELNHVLRGKASRTVKEKGFDTIKTFGAGKSFTRRQWCYWLIQMIQQNIIYIDYADNCCLKVLEKGRKVLKGEVDVALEGTTEKLYKIVWNGVAVFFDLDIYDSINWREYIRDLNRIIYWNYKEVRRLNINDIIPEGIKERGRVKEKYIDISKELFNLTCDGEVIIIPKKVDLDIYGNEVKSLALPFEECLAKFEHFVQTNGRYPQMNASAEEVALRKWYREIGHGIITITAAQKTELYSFTAQYPDINKGK